MHIVVVGHGWMAGKMMYALRQHKTVQLSHGNVISFLNATVSRSPVSWVVNCAGITGTPNVDACESMKAQTIMANSVFPVQLQAMCEKWHARLFHFSSGCIFQGGPFGEDDEPNFDGSVYSASKLASDQALKYKAIVARIRMPFDCSSSPKNLLMKLAHYARTRRILDGFNSLSDADEMAEVAADLIVEGVPDGVYHLVNQGAIWTHEIMAILGIEAEYWDTEEFYKTFPARRSECQLTTKLITEPVRMSLQRAVANMREVA